MLNSFCQILVTFLGLTLPWQLLAAHPPGPLYFPTPLAGGADDCGPAVAATRLISRTATLAASPARPAILRAPIVFRTREATPMRVKALRDSTLHRECGKWEKKMH